MFAGALRSLGSRRKRFGPGEVQGSKKTKVQPRPSVGERAGSRRGSSRKLNKMSTSVFARVARDGEFFDSQNAVTATGAAFEGAEASPVAIILRIVGPSSWI